MSQCFHEPISTETNDYDELPDTPVLDVSPASDSFEFPHLWGTLVCIDSQMEHTGMAVLYRLTEVVDFFFFFYRLKQQVSILLRLTKHLNLVVASPVSLGVVCVSAGSWV